MAVQGPADGARDAGRWDRDQALGQPGRDNLGRPRPTSTDLGQLPSTNPVEPPQPASANFSRPRSSRPRGYQNVVKDRAGGWMKHEVDVGGSGEAVQYGEMSEMKLSRSRRVRAAEPSKKDAHGAEKKCGREDHVGMSRYAQSRHLVFHLPHPPQRSLILLNPLLIPPPPILQPNPLIPTPPKYALPEPHRPFAFLCISFVFALVVFPFTFTAPAQGRPSPTICCAGPLAHVSAAVGEVGISARGIWWREPTTASTADNTAASRVQHNVALGAAGTTTKLVHRAIPRARSLQHRPGTADPRAYTDVHTPNKSPLLVAARARLGCSRLGRSCDGRTDSIVHGRAGHAPGHGYDMAKGTCAKSRFQAGA
ncbi:hypothetical protein B0H19DRAFT_1378666 [Mycena capillaripes]|nr:hypothetical protein B0H19DRAFT_1378666 [Mycena capillaripes]